MSTLRKLLPSANALFVFEAAARENSFSEAATELNVTFTDLVDATKLRWRIERDYQDLKQEVGLGTMKGEAGAVSTIMPRCASRPTAP